jgi:hypothetical protein
MPPAIIGSPRTDEIMAAIKITAALVLSLAGAQAHAADLWLAPSTDGFTILIDGAQVGKEPGDLTKAVYYMNGLTDKQTFAELHVEFNCAARQVRVGKVQIYNAKFEPAPDLSPPKHDQWEKADDGETGKLLTNFACGPRADWPRLGVKLAEATWREAMTQQLLKAPAAGKDGQL